MPTVTTSNTPADPAPTPTTSAAPPAEPPTVDPATPPAPPTPPVSSGGPNQGDLTPAQIAALQAERDAALAREAALQARVAEADAAAEAARQAELSELEKEKEKTTALEARLAALEAERVEQKKVAAFIDEAMAKGADPARRAALLRLVDLSEVTLTTDGGVVGVEAAIEQARTLAPEFFGGSVTTTATTADPSPRQSERNPPAPEGDYQRGASLMKSHKTKRGGSDKKRL